MLQNPIFLIFLHNADYTEKVSLIMIGYFVAVIFECHQRFLACLILTCTPISYPTIRDLGETPFQGDSTPKKIEIFGTKYSEFTAPKAQQILKWRFLRKN